MTAEGKYVYGKTVSCTMGNENTPWGILVRPANGWILQSSSAEGNYPDHITVDDGVEIFWILFMDLLNFCLTHLESIFGKDVHFTVKF